MHRGARWRAFLLILFGLVAIEPSSFKAYLGTQQSFPLDSGPSQESDLQQVRPEVSDSVANDRSRPLREIATEFAPLFPLADAPEVVIPETVVEQPGQVPAESVSDPVVQLVPGLNAMPPVSLSFEALSSDDNAAVLGGRPIPPDPVGDVGPNHYMQTVNLIFAVYDKTGTRLLGPLPNNAVWAGFGGPCQTTNAGDAIVLYDHLSDRWLFSQFTPAMPPFHQCIAISVTGDPTGEWYRYDFVLATPRFNDYPKFGVWPNAYYMSSGARGIPGPPTDVFAFERDRMLLGQPARVVGFATHPVLGYTGVQPSDLDGFPTFFDAPNYFVGVKQSVPQALYLFEFRVDWNNPAAATFGVGGLPNSTLSIAPFVVICPATRSCIPQPDTDIRLDALAGRYVMYRAQYRHFGTHESIVFNHTVDAGDGRAGVRWYEIRNPGNAPFIHQQGTYAPADGQFRWMGSAAMDRQGNLAIGFSLGSASVYPSIFYAGRLRTDPLGELTQGEALMQLGSGSQLSTSNRWGDYSMMAVDPTDDCTFWYTTEYVAITASARWQTRVGKFRFDSCTPPWPFGQ
jgi:hypothetical protein